MKITNLFTKTTKHIDEEVKAVSHNYLTRAGFVHQEMSGVYTILPLGRRVLTRIENIIRKEMDSIGSQEVTMPVLHPKERWIKSGRSEMDVLFETKSRWSKSEYFLGPTHEEIVVPLVGRFLSSYKDLPISVYQIQTKFRDEKRAKSGIIRGREFVMKDMYSFHETPEELEEYYEKVKLSYLKIFDECGIKAKVTKASGGDFTKKYSHEFMALSSAGEDLIFTCLDCSYAENSEVSQLKENDSCPECQGKIFLKKAIEVGNIFDLNNKFSQDFNLSYTNEKGEKKMPVSGCYGIGTTRLIGAIVENNHDDKGIIWPATVAPFQVHLISLNQESEEIYQKLLDKGVEVLYDNRLDKTAGEKFNDADLIGIPLRVVVSSKNPGQVEIKKRNNEEVSLVEIEEFIENI